MSALRPTRWRRAGAAILMFCAGASAHAVEAPTPTCPKPVSQAYRFCTGGGPIDLTATQATTLTPIAQYPVHLAASGAQGAIASLEVQLEDFSHTRMDQLRIVLQAPSGRAMVLRDGYTAAVQTVAAFDHSAPRMDFADMADRGSQYPTFPGSELLGTRFIPTFATRGASGVPAPAPAPPFAAFFDDFSGESPNGTWKIWVAHAGNRAIPASGSIGRVCLAVGTHDAATPCASVAQTVISGGVSSTDPTSVASVLAAEFIGNCHPGDPDSGSVPGSIDFGIPPARDTMLQTALTTVANPLDIPVCAVIDADYSGCQGSRPRLWVTRTLEGYNPNDEFAVAKIEVDRSVRAAWGVRLMPGQSANFRVGPGTGGDCPQFRYDVKLVTYGTRTDRIFRSGF